VKKQRAFLYIFVTKSQRTSLYLSSILASFLIFEKEGKNDKKVKANPLPFHRKIAVMLRNASMVSISQQKTE
jgi:hypothetical protein